MKYIIKNSLQEHLKENFKFSHRIDFEPSPSHPLPYDELNQRLRKIGFDLNKKYLKSKYFPKFKMEDKFFFIGCKQGAKNTGTQPHYHLLLHTPKNFKIDVFNDLIWSWLKGAGVNPVSGRRRKTISYTKDNYHLSAEPLEENFLIKVAAVKNNDASIIYNTRHLNKQMHKNEELICI
jgi:hypothetical protein|tara:strand:- start:357 stop:890 length:534 start_codon:yes stop_codon:yes gene_type:complete